MEHSRRFIPHMTEEALLAKQSEGLRWTVAHAHANSPQLRAMLDEVGIAPEDVRSLDDLRALPCSTVEDLRLGYPLPLLAVPEEDIARVHASSGTTGKRKVMAYTQGDIETWKLMFARCYELAGLTALDRVQIAVGYGLWTAGAGFQLGCEHFGAMAVPVGPGNLEMQLALAEDMQATCLCATASMALLMAEEADKRGLVDRLALKRCIFGAETHSPKMREAFMAKLGLEDAFDIAGLTELYGPGAALECSVHQGLHYWGDIYILEVLDPATLEPVPPGAVGEMVVTTLCKEAAPLIRYRTRDLTRLIPGTCPCGVTMPRHDRILGRSDDMIIYRGVNIYPGQIADALESVPELSSEYRIQLERREGRDAMTVSVERAPGVPAGGDDALAKTFELRLRDAILARAAVVIVDPGELPRSFAKTKRVVDNRE